MDFENIFRQLLSFITDKLNKQQKIILGSTLTIVVLFIAFLIIFSGKSDQANNMKILFSSLSNQDSALVIQQLQADQIPYMVVDDKIMVHGDIVYEQRIKLSAAGIPKDTKVGFELFDEQSFGSTDFEQKIKFLRALEGELSRTIESLSPIEAAIVHIAIPESTVFVAKETAPTVSVAITLHPNMTLSIDQVVGIKNLISASVPKLDTENVRIVDNQGQPLDSNTKLASTQKMAGMQMTYKQKYEHMYEQKIIDILSPFVGGQESVTAKVTIEFDFTQSTSISENFSPNNVAVSESILEEKRQGSKVADSGGVPGAVSNIGPVQGVDGASTQEEYQKTQTNTNYEVSKTTLEKEEEFAKIKRIHSAVVVDGTYSVALDESGSSAINYQARTPEEIVAMEDLVRRTIGFSDERKDQVTVSNFRFSFPALKHIPTQAELIFIFLGNNQVVFSYMIALVLLFLTYKLVIKRFIDRMLDSYMDEVDKKSALVKLSDIEEEEETINKADEARKRIEQQLNSEDVNENDIKYDIMYQKLKDVLASSPEEASQLFAGLIRNDMEAKKA